MESCPWCTAGILVQMRYVELSTASFHVLTCTHTKAVPCSNVRVVLDIRAVCQRDSELKKHTHHHGNQSHKPKCTSHFPAFKSYFFFLKETHQSIFFVCEGWKFSLRGTKVYNHTVYNKWKLMVCILFSLWVLCYHWVTFSMNYHCTYLIRESKLTV